MKRMDELLERAFQLAHFIHGDDEVAKRIALEAAKKLEAAMAAQDKRRYYLLSRKSRRKVSLGELPTLQRLVYEESEEHEKRREQAGQPSKRGSIQETMIVHFVKHLVRITVRQNSIHVVVGVSRLLHDYKTPDTAELCTAIRQSPDRTPDDDFLRATKAKLMSELKKRFGDLLRVNRGARGEERFLAHENPSRFIALIQECLRQFTPWGTQCVVPENFDARTNELPDLYFKGGDPDEEHPIEANRFHATLDPVCFDRLMTGMGREAPANRLTVPLFHFGESDSAGEDHSPEKGNSPPRLSEEDRRQMSQHLESQSARRKASAANPSGTMLTVLVDGEECARLNALANGEASFLVGESAELIEVKARDSQGEFFLFTHLLIYETTGDALKAEEFETSLDGGQRLAFNIAPLISGKGGTVEFRYFAPQPGSVLAQLKSWFFPAKSGLGWLKPVLTYGLLLVAALLLNRLAQKDGGNELAIVTPSPTPLADVMPLYKDDVIVTPTPIEQTTPKPVSPSLSAGDVVARNVYPSGTDATRNSNAGEDIKRVNSLLAAKRLAIKTNNSEVARAFGEAMKLRLQSKLKFDFTNTATEADDVALNLVVRPSNQGLEVIASINNRVGEVLWPLAPGASGRRYIGSKEKIMDRLGRELLSDIQRLERKQK